MTQNISLKKKIAPSVMCIDYAKFTDTLKIFEDNKIDYLHVDIMDGEFVPNFTLGTDFCKQLRSLSNIPLDIHLMIKNPDLKLGWFNFREGEYVSVHYESTPHIQRALTQIKDMGAKPMIALCPGTPINVLDYVSDIIDGVLIMTVNPGFAGQKLVPSTLEKIRDTRKLLDSKGRQDAEIEVDGNCSFENIKKMSALGANIFVGGSSSIFCKANPIEENINLTYEATK